MNWLSRKRRSTHWSCLGASVIAVASAACAVANEPASADDAGAPDRLPRATASAESSVELRELALAIARRGERERAAELLLVAVDLLRQTGASDDEGPQRWLAQAREWAGQDQAVVAMIAQREAVARAEAPARADAPSHGDDCGIDFQQGQNLPSRTVSNWVYKVLDTGTLQPHSTGVTLRNVRFDGNAVAIVLVIGEEREGNDAGGGDVDLWITENQSGRHVVSDTSFSSRCIVRWTPPYTMGYNLRYANVGSRAERYVVLANW